MDDYNGFNVQLLGQFLKIRAYDSKIVRVISAKGDRAVPKGENYVSNVFRVKLRCLLASGKQKTFSMIVKQELQSDSAKEALAPFPVFRTEVKMYTTILRFMEDLMDEFEDTREKCWADLYGFEPYNLVVFEDLKDKNYAVAERRKCLDLKHSVLVLRNLGRYHAMSRVLLSRGLISQDDKGKITLASKDDTCYKWWEAMITVLTDAMINTWGEEWVPIGKKLKGEMMKIPEKASKLAEEYDKRFEVLNHGDLWTCNLMFKYMEDEQIPVSMKFVDFQVCNLNSFIWDVEYFLNTSTIPSIRRAHKNELFQTYQQSLEKNLKFFNYSGYIPTLEDIKAESKRIEYGQLCILVVHPCMCAETTRAFDLEKVMTHPPEEVVDASVYSDGKTLHSLGEDFKYLYDNGVF